MSLAYHRLPGLSGEMWKLSKATSSFPTEDACGALPSKSDLWSYSRTVSNSGRKTEITKSVYYCKD